MDGMDGLLVEPTDDLAFVERMLAAAELPVADVRTGTTRFYAASLGGERVGVGGVERSGSDALLRSVAVVEERRGEGVGSTLCAELERRAAHDGIRALYLLTTTAADFFAKRGYGRVEREAVPQPLRETPQFASLCPDSAVAMRKRLDDR